MSFPNGSLFASECHQRMPRNSSSIRLFGAFPAARRPLQLYNVFDCIARINTMLSVSSRQPLYPLVHARLFQDFRVSSEPVQLQRPGVHRSNPARHRHPSRLPMAGHQRRHGTQRSIAKRRHVCLLRFVWKIACSSVFSISFRYFNLFFSRTPCTA